MDLRFWEGKRVFLTGHTGFKGSWLSHILSMLGANVTGYALKPDAEENLYEISEVQSKVSSVFGDIRHLPELQAAFSRANPEIVIHMAAQPLVRDSYRDPVYTYETNVMGTVNMLECIRHSKSVRSFLNVTTDKVYHNNEWEWGYREVDALGGFDPYSNSKACSELVTQSFRDAFFSEGAPAVSTVRAGNVIGGGDFASDRIIPDCIRAALHNRTIVVRNPKSTRPYQHVLEPLFAYLLICQMQYEDASFADSYNIGPEFEDCVTTGHLVDLFCSAWGSGVKWESMISESANEPHEAGFLKLDCSKAKARLGWSPKWDVAKAIECTVQWIRAYRARGEIVECMRSQILEYAGGA